MRVAHQHALLVRSLTCYSMHRYVPSSSGRGEQPASSSYGSAEQPASRQVESIHTYILSDGTHDFWTVALDDSTSEAAKHADKTLKRVLHINTNDSMESHLTTIEGSLGKRADRFPVGVVQALRSIAGGRYFVDLVYLTSEPHRPVLAVASNAPLRRQAAKLALVCRTLCESDLIVIEATGKLDATFVEQSLRAKFVFHRIPAWTANESPEEAPPPPPPLETTCRASSDAHPADNLASSDTMLADARARVKRARNKIPHAGTCRHSCTTRP